MNSSIQGPLKCKASNGRESRLTPSNGSELNAEQIEKYLKRIGYNEELDISANTLMKLQHCHLLTVPFENMDAFVVDRMSLDIEHLYNKVVLNTRGGWCHELNGLFCQLLIGLGFDAHLVSADVYQGTKWITYQNTHVAILVNGLGPFYCYADVGFGMHKAIFDPFMLRPGAEYEQPNGYIKVSKDGDLWVLSQKDTPDSDWEPSTRFLEDSISLAECQSRTDTLKEGTLPELLMFSAIPIVFLRADDGYTVLSIIADNFRQYTYSRGGDKIKTKEEFQEGLSTDELREILEFRFEIDLREDEATGQVLELPGKEHPFFKEQKD